VDVPLRKRMKPRQSISCLILFIDISRIDLCLPEQNVG
jgi:hypothetical protein